MRLKRGSMVISSKVGKHGLPAIGVLLYSKGQDWYYALTSPRHEDGIVQTIVHKDKRESIVRGITSGTVLYYPAKKKGKS